MYYMDKIWNKFKKYIKIYIYKLRNYKISHVDYYLTFIIKKYVLNATVDLAIMVKSYRGRAAIYYLSEIFKSRDPWLKRYYKLRICVIGLL